MVASEQTLIRVWPHLMEILASLFCLTHLVTVVMYVYAIAWGQHASIQNEAAMSALLVLQRFAIPPTCQVLSRPLVLVWVLQVLGAVLARLSNDCIPSDVFFHANTGMTAAL